MIVTVQMGAWTHRNLAAWQQAMNLAEMVYRDTAGFPDVDRFGLSAHMRRAAVSIPSNIAEGSGRNSPRELLQFLGVTCGSVAELETQVELAIRLGYLDAKSGTVAQTSLVGRLVNGLRKSIRARCARKAA